MPHRPRKNLGQHFLHDPLVIQRIVHAIDPVAGDHMIEIGPGEGAITAPILKRIGTLEVIEFDRDLIAPLQARCREHGRLIVHNLDALEFDFPKSPTAGMRVVGNLPYNISTPLIFRLIESAGGILDMHFLLQKEVVQRLAAGPGTKDYGRLTVMVQYRCDVEALFRVGPGAFKPPPRVDSQFLRIVPLRTPPHLALDEALFARLVSAAFAQRRKTLRNALGRTIDEDAFRHAGIDPARRGETLSVAEFVTLANAALTTSDR